MEKQKEVYGIIYVIRNKINGKLYIGQTISGFNKRYNVRGEGIERVYNYHKIKKDHAPKSCNEHLLRSMEKYGIDNFEVDECFDVAYSKEELDKLEDMYIKIYNTVDGDYGYNNKYGGANGKFNENIKNKISDKTSGIGSYWYGKEFSKEHRKHLKEAKRDTKGEKSVNSKPVMCIELEEIKQCSTQWGEELNVSPICIRDCCRGKQKTCRGYHFKYATTEEIREYNLKNNTNIIDNEEVCIKDNKPIYCYELNSVKETAKEWGKELGLFSDKIKGCCMGKRKSTGGYHFRYATEEELKELMIK